ncbi:unnamed protein product [Linum trigynum]|uniref:Major facilitator superfamily (MFS) profile domain-containing protein n=1 Tax=Linum trigynum TaxID=586398 RepID=A0AAV2DP95_9ROSI
MEIQEETEVVDHHHHVVEETIEVSPELAGVVEAAAAIQINQEEQPQPIIVADVPPSHRHPRSNAPPTEASPPFFVVIHRPPTPTDSPGLRRVLVTSIRAKLLSYPISLAFILFTPFFLYGCDVGLMNAAKEIEKDLKITSLQAGFLAGFMTRVPGILGALFAGVTANLIGRKYVALIGSVLYLIGAVTILFTGEYTTSMAGRALTGLGIGAGLVIGPVFIAEVAPSKRRAFLTTFPQLLLILGWAYAWIPSAHPRWRAKLLISAGPCLVSTLLLACLPDTPCAIITMSGKLEDAEEVMSKCGVPEGEREARLGELQTAAKIPIHLVTNEEAINAPSRRRRITWFLEDPATVTGFTGSLLMTAALFVAQELALEHKNLQHAGLIFEKHWHTYKASRVAIMVLVCIKVVGALVPVFTANASGRRRILLLVSMGATGVFLVALGGMLLADFRARRTTVPFPLYCVVFVGVELSPAIGLGAVPWMHGPEAFPLLIRTPFFGLCVAVKLGIRQLLTVRLPLLTHSDTLGFGYLLLGGVLAIGFVLCWIFFRDDRTRKLLVDDTVAHRLWSVLALKDHTRRPLQNV